MHDSAYIQAFKMTLVLLSMGSLLHKSSGVRRSGLERLVWSPTDVDKASWLKRPFINWKLGKQFLNENRMSLQGHHVLQWLLSKIARI